MYFDRKARERNRENRRRYEMEKVKREPQLNFEYSRMMSLLISGKKEDFISYARACNMETSWISETWNKYRKDDQINENYLS